jgi:glycosyltransferase involved in cell wall biosynthesis
VQGIRDATVTRVAPRAPGAAERPPRLLIFVVAYYAETTLKAVLERIPGRVFEDYDCEILVVDDASEDRTFAIGRAYQEDHPEIRITVLRNAYNQGYGGNQKVGYTYAMAEGFDFVAMVHGDGQYAPEELPRLLEPLRANVADAVFGSRMLTRFGALRGGMPIYKYVGNRVLTWVQNLLLRTSFSEFHSGYRIYSVAALRRIPFQLNSNEFHFDTEIILQLLNAGARIEERPIPTYYGDEICRVAGLRYAFNVIRSTLGNRLHRLGLLYQRRFDVEIHNRHYDLKLGYPSSHSYALAAVPAGASVMDIGSGPGGMAEQLAAKGCRAAVVDRHPVQRPPQGVAVVVQDLDDELHFDVADYDYILLLDILEHLKSAEGFLERLRRQFTHTPKTVIVTLPNVAFIVPRLMLLLGFFNYGKAGILDRTHTRLYTFGSARRLVRDAGFRIKRVRGIPVPFPKALGEGLLGRAVLLANLVLLRLSRSLFSYQIYIEAETTPTVEFVLLDTKRASVAPPPHPLEGRPDVPSSGIRASPVPP